MKRLLVLSNLLFWFTICNAQNDSIDYSVKIKERAEAMAQLLLKKDFDAFSAYTYPKL